MDVLEYDETQTHSLGRHVLCIIDEGRLEACRSCNLRACCRDYSVALSPRPCLIHFECILVLVASHATFIVTPTDVCVVVCILFLGDGHDPHHGVVIAFFVQDSFA